MVNSSKSDKQRNIKICIAISQTIFVVRDGLDKENYSRVKTVRPLERHIYIQYTIYNYSKTKLRYLKIRSPPPDPSHELIK
jgi:hypothetical protein